MHKCMILCTSCNFDLHSLNPFILHTDCDFVTFGKGLFQVLISMQIIIVLTEIRQTSLIFSQDRSCTTTQTGVVVYKMLMHINMKLVLLYHLQSTIVVSGPESFMGSHQCSFVGSHQCKILTPFPHRISKKYGMVSPWSGWKYTHCITT